MMKKYSYTQIIIVFIFKFSLYYTELLNKALKDRSEI